MCRDLTRKFRFDEKKCKRAETRAANHCLMPFVNYAAAFVIVAESIPVGRHSSYRYGLYPYDKCCTSYTYLSYNTITHPRCEPRARYNENKNVFTEPFGVYRNVRAFGYANIFKNRRGKKNSNLNFPRSVS